MKSGVSLQQMLTEVKRQSESKEDYLIAPNRLRMESYGKEMFLHLSDDSGTELIEPMTITGIAHRQIGTHLRIPAAYYDRMREERPDLLAYNANTWFKQESSQRMLRTLDGSARAYLSNRYRRIDNIDIAGVTLPILGGLPDIRFESCQITESRMYIKAVNPRLQAEVSPGDIVQAGVIISNSEVGLGSVSIQPLIYRLVCSNGMVVNEAAARRNHVGRANDSEENFSVYSQATLDAEDKAFVMKIQDTVRAAVEEARFAQVVGKMQEAKAAQMDTHDVPAVVKLASKEFHITDSESTGVLQRLIESNDLTLYGLSNAVTRHSQDVESYDRASELESINFPLYKGRRTSMWDLIPRKLMPPTRVARYCCAVLKEQHGKGRFLATGVRWAESVSRSKRRGIFEKHVSNRDKEVHIRNDEESLNALFAPCKLAAKRFVNPIVDWSDREVWDCLCVCPQRQALFTIQKTSTRPIGAL